MQEIEIIAWGKKYIINNNSDKYERAKREAGRSVSPETILAIYDRLAGLIKDEQGNKIENGDFWRAYEKRKEEQLRYIKILEDKEISLEEGEKQTIALISKNIDHKRAFLGTSMTITAAVLAGLFILLTIKDLNNDCFNLAIISGLGFAIFIISSSIYLTAILSQESLSLDSHLRFIKESKRDFIEKIGTVITDIDSYEQYREQKYKKEKESRREVRGSHEIWFVLINVLFMLSFLLLLVMFLSSVSKLCITQ